MAQLSSNTLAYQQIYDRLRSFFLKDARREFESNQQRLEEYNQILSDLYYSISAPSAKYVPFIKGEPPSSAKVNSFTQAMSIDVRNISSQSDFLSAKVINAFNMFAVEIENEKGYINRIGSKAKILQMYNRAEAEDIVYFGDSFENLDYVDIAKVKTGKIPMVKNGYATLPLIKSNAKSVSKVSVIDGNGFAGNNHQVINDTSEEGTSAYRFIGLSTPFLGNAKSISDSNPATFMEYEALYVDKSNFSGDNIPSGNEFCYVSTRNYSEEIQPNSLLNWSDFSIENDSPLHLTVEMEMNTPKLVNSVDIHPYFKSQNMVTISSVKVFSTDGSFEEVLQSPIYIGSSLSPLNIDVSKNYFYDKASIKFSEKIVSKIQVKFEQDTPKDIEVLHSYWSPAYGDGDGEDSPFKEMKRFNPDALVGYSDIEYSKTSLLPKVDDPFYFKQNDDMYVVHPVYLKKENYIDNFYVLKFTERDSGLTFYLEGFSDWPPEAGIQQGDYPPGLFFGDTINTRPTVTSSGTRRYSTAEDGSTDKEYLIDFFENSGTLVSDGVYQILTSNMFTGSSPISTQYFTIEISSIDFENIQKEIIPENVRYNVPLRRQSETLSAKRFAIGLKDISLHYEEYGSGMEIVSKRFSFPSELETVMLDVDLDLDEDAADSVSLKYYISVEDGKWIEVSPIQLSFSGIPEVVSFNNSIPQSQMLSGVSYFNYPDVPEKVNSIVVKIVADKSKNINTTPKINSYQIIGKVKS